jgi:hypothetical protein
VFWFFAMSFSLFPVSEDLRRTPPPSKKVGGVRRSVCVRLEPITFL